MGQVDLKPSFFRTLAAQKDRYLIWVCLLALFLGGAYLWVIFLHRGINLMTYGDWAHITGPRLALVRDAMLQGTLPFHAADPKWLKDIPRYFSVPDVFASPQAILLRFMTVEQFTVVNTLLLYGLGFWGLLRIRSRYHLSLLPFSLLFLLYNFNGHILAHFTAGHANWWSNFLFIWLILWILEAIQNGGGWQWVMKISILLLAIFLQGGYHQFVWSLFFIGLIGVSYPRLFLLMFKTAVASVALSLVRLLPILLVAGEFKTTIYGGYPSLLSIWTNLVVPAEPGKYIQAMGLNTLNQLLGSWELSLYVGLLGAFFLLGFGVFYLLKDKERPNMARLLLPCAGMLLLSMGWIFSHLSTYLPLPIFTGEEVSARFTILPLLTVLALATIECQRWLDGHPRLFLQWLFAVGLALEANDLVLNFRTWQVNLAAKQFPARFFDPSAWRIANDYHDYAYFAALGTGLLLSLFCLAVLIFLTRREIRSTSNRSASP